MFLTNFCIAFLRGILGSVQCGYCELYVFRAFVSYKYISQLNTVFQKHLNDLLKNSSTGISILSWSIHVKPISTFSAKSFQCFRFSSVPSYSGMIHGKVSHRTYRQIRKFIISNNIKLVKFNCNTLYSGKQMTSMNSTCICGSSSFFSLSIIACPR